MENMDNVDLSLETWVRQTSKRSSSMFLGLGGHSKDSHNTDPVGNHYGE